MLGSALGAAMRLRVNTVSILRHLFSGEVQIMLDMPDYLDYIYSQDDVNH